MKTPGAQAAVAAELESILASYRVPSTRRSPTTPWTMRIRVRRASLRRLVTYRRLHHLPMGNEPGWTAMILNLLHCEGSPTDNEEVIRLGRWLGLPPLAAPSVVAAAKGIFGRRLLCDGSLVQLTAVEREGARIRDIDAFDETAADRKRRMARERQRKRRGPAKPKVPKPWTLLKMSRATWYRLRKPAR